MKGILSLLVAGLASAGQDAVKPGSRCEIEVEGLGQPVVFRVPANYTADREWPVLVYYHGTHGRPTLALLDDYTRRRDFVTIGMGYVRPGRFQYSEENLRREIDACHEAIDRVARRCRIDRSRIYVGGFSKGGWVSAMFIDHDPRFAGGFVMGGGVYDRQLYEAEPFRRRTPVYIGVGRRDGNTIMSLNAKLHFRGLGAEVTLDVWPELGHEPAVGRHRSPALAQWFELLLLEDRPEERRRRMEAWFEAELAERGVLEDPRERYMALQALAEMPATVFLGKPARSRLDARLDELRAEEPVKGEWAIQQRYQRIVRHELRDRHLETLETCARGYLALSEEHPGSIYGRLAAIDYERARKVIELTRERIPGE